MDARPHPVALMTELSARVTRVLDGLRLVRENDGGAIPLLHPESGLREILSDVVAACVRAAHEDSDVEKSTVDNEYSSSLLR